jgi:hypothetical protein
MERRETERMSPVQGSGGHRAENFVQDGRGQGIVTAVCF